MSFLKVTTSEREIGLLLIETFRKTKLWPPGFDPWWPFLYVRSSWKPSFMPEKVAYLIWWDNI